MVASVGGRHTLSCFYELVLPRRVASNGQEQTAALGGQGTCVGACERLAGWACMATATGPGKGDGWKEPYARWSLVISPRPCPQALWQALSTPQIKLAQSPCSSPLICLMSWFLGVSAGGHACGHPAHLPGSRGSPREEIKGRRGRGLTMACSHYASLSPSRAGVLRLQRASESLGKWIPRLFHCTGQMCRWELDWDPKWFNKPQALILKLVGKDPLPGEPPLSWQSQHMAPPTSQHGVPRWSNDRCVVT